MTQEMTYVTVYSNSFLPTKFTSPTMLKSGQRFAYILRREGEIQQTAIR